MEDLLLYIAKELVNHPDEVKVLTNETESGCDMILQVHPDDMGKIIGKQGKIAKSIRSIVKAIGMKQDKMINLEIQELS